MVSDGAKLRVFAAVPLSDAAKEWLGTAQNRLRQRLAFKKWVYPQDFHITLQFIGEAEESGIAGIGQALREAAGTAEPFRLSVDGAGCFGPPSAPRVLWAGLGGDWPALSALQEAASKRLSGLGYKPDREIFRPHVTMARTFTGGRLDPEDLREALKEVGLTESAGRGEGAGEDPEGRGNAVQWRADRLVLYRTRFGMRPMYEPIIEARLGE